MSNSSSPPPPLSPPSHPPLAVRIQIISPEFTLGSNIMLIMLAVLMCIPLYKMSKTRMVMVILLSKTIGNILSTSVITSVIFTNLLNVISPSLQSTLTALISVHPLFVRLHLLALGLNRMQSVFVPIGYSSEANKKFTWPFCVFIWLFCCIQSILTTFFQSIIPLSPGLMLIFNQICVFGATFFYACISAKLLYLKFKSSLGNQSEIDHIKICCVCILGLVPFLLASIMPGWQVGTRLDPSTSNIEIILINLNNYLCYYIEDFCLLIVCRDFQQIFISSFFCCFLKPRTSVPAARIVMLHEGIALKAIGNNSGGNNCGNIDGTNRRNAIIGSMHRPQLAEIH